MIFFSGEALFAVAFIAIILFSAIIESAVSWFSVKGISIFIAILPLYLLRVAAVLRRLWRQSGRPVLSLICGLMAKLPPIYVYYASYHYLQRQIEENGATSGVAFDYAIAIAVYAIAGYVWHRLVVQDQLGPFGTIIWTLLYLLVSSFFLFGFGMQ